MCLSSYNGEKIGNKEIAIYGGQDCFDCIKDFAKAFFDNDEKNIEKYLKESKKYQEQLESKLKSQKDFLLEGTYITNLISEKVNKIIRNLPI